MKLYATVVNEKHRAKGVGSEKWLEVSFQVGNKHIGQIILDYQGNKDWDLSYEKNGEPSYLIDSSENYQAKKQKGEGQTVLDIIIEKHDMPQ